MLKQLVFLAACLVVATTGKKVDTVIGIDLGTTYSCVGVYKNGRVQIIANDQGNRITPSYVGFTETERLVGDAAKNQASLNPENTVFDVKRLIGRQFKDPEVQQDKKLMPYDIIKREGKPYISVTSENKKQVFSPEEVSAMVLKKMKTTAENFLGKEVFNAVVTVPAYFNDAQRQATKDAGTIAGLNVLRIINEPTAAAIAYGLDEKPIDTNILVYDLGGGTFDVSILSLDDGVFEVLATNGDTHLGGEDFDQRVMQFFLKLIKKKHGIDLSKNKRALAKLRRETEKAKRALSTNHQTTLEIESLLDGEDFAEVLTRAKFEELNDDLFKKTMEPISKVLKDSGLKTGEIDEVVLVGGSTRIPRVQELIKTFFDGKELNRGINPDEAVAYGAAVQGGILSGEGGDEVKDVLLLDVTPLSLGIQMQDGTMQVLIERNSVIPTKKQKVFSTGVDNQPNVMTKVFQGERPMCKDNVLLGEFLLELPPAPRGVPQIEVTFEIDANGIVKVGAEDKSTGAGETITISAESGRLSEEEIERMVRDAEEHAEEDKLLRETMDLRNELETYAYNMISTVSDDSEGGAGRLINDEDHDAIIDSCNDVLDWLDEKNREPTLEDYEEQLTELENVCQPIMDELEGGGGGGGQQQQHADDYYRPREEL